MPPREAAAYASATAGRAVIFAGLTVAISITGLAVIGIPFITKLGMGGALGVLTAVLYATFLLPGLLALIGHRIDRLKVPFLKRERRVRGGARRHPPGSLGRLHREPLGPRPDASRCSSCRCSSLPDARARGSARPTPARRPRTRPARKAYDILTTGFGAGLQRRRSRSSSSRTAIRRPRSRSTWRPSSCPSRRPRSCSRVIYNKAKDVGLVVISPATAPQSSETDDLINTLRDDDHPEGARRERGAGLRERPERRVHRHQQPHLRARAVVPALHHRRHDARALDGLPLGRDRVQGRHHDAHLGHRGLRAC